MEENKEILDLLKQIEKTNHQQVRTGRLLCVFGLIAALCCLATFGMVFHILPEITETLPQINTVIGQMQTVLGNLESTTDQLASMDLQTMVSDVDALVVTGQQSLEQTMEKLNSIDIATLNKAIADLAAVVEPLAKLADLF